MRHTVFRRGMALLLAVVMVLGLSNGVQAAPASRTITAEKLDSIGTELFQSGTAIENKNEPIHADTDVVRVLIVLEDKPALEKASSASAFTVDVQAVNYRAQLQAKQEKLAQKISSQALMGQKLDVVWNLTLMANAISANVTYGSIQRIAQVDGVKKVYLETVYHPQTAETNNIIAQEMTGADVAQNSYGYYGAGTAIAVVDTGTDPDHQSFSGAGFEYALAQNAAEAGMELDAYVESLDLIDAAYIAELLPQLNVGKRFPELTAEELYLNAKMPFNFNYVDGNLNVSHDFDDMGSHGSHVAGIAAANRYIPVEELCDLNSDGIMDAADAQLLMDHIILGTEILSPYTADLNKDGTIDEQDVTALLDAIDQGSFVDAAETVGVTGVAPDAQILTMKVFGETGGAYSSDYMAATEDAMILGCASVNLSLGGSNPGFTSSHEVEASDTAYVDGLMERLADSGMVMCTSAGNSGNWADNDAAYGMMYADEGGTYTASEPGTYANTLGIASADNVGLVTDLKTSFGTTEFRMEGVSGGVNEPWISLDPQSKGTTFECVFLGDPSELLNPLGEQTDLSIYGGNVSDFVDVEGKVVLVARGNGVSFADKHANGALAGAAAVIIYNNVDDVVYASIEGSTATIPCAMMTLAQAQSVYALFNGTSGTMTVEYKLNVNHDTNEDEDHIAMSDFSSWGTTGDLTLKPEITAPGGNIYSVNGVDPSGKAYEQMSGTSMSSPHVAGLVALASEFLADKGYCQQTGLSQRVLTQSLLMSTAEVILENELPYSVRNQGAGLASIEKLIQADSYILVDGQPDGKVKAELGDGTEERTFTFSVNNLTDSEKTYVLSAELMTSGLLEIDGHMLATDEMAPLRGDVTFSTGNTVTVPANGSVSVTVTVAVDEDMAQRLMDDGFTNGFYIEGFVYAEPVADGEGAVGSAHSIPMLGWYGCWTDIPMYETADHMDYAYNTLERPTHNADFSTNILSWAPKGYGSGMYYSGNIYGSINAETGEAIGDSRYIEARNAVNSQESIWELFAVYPTLNRNAADVKLTVYDSETGEVYYVNDFEETDDYLLSSFYYANYGQWYNTTTESPVDLTQWEFTDLKGDPLPEDTRFTIELACAPDYYVGEDGTVDWSQVGQGAYLRWNFNVDTTAPELVGSLKLEGDKLHYEVRDNNYIAAVILITGDLSSAIDYAFPDMDEDQQGKSTSGTLDLTGYQELFGQKAAIAVCDYAGNESYYAINLGGEGAGYGDLVAFRYDSDNYTGSWVAFSEGVARNETGLFPSDVDMVAAEYVNGLVFCQDNSGNLYGIKYADMLANSVDLEQSYITRLDNVYQDFAYSYADGKLYGLITYEEAGMPTTEVNTINLRGDYYDDELWMDVAAYQEDWAASRGGLYGLAMAIDDTGSVYVLGPVYNDETEQVEGTAHLWKASMEEQWGWVSLGAFKDLGDTGMGMDYLQSMTWDHNTESLYWAQFFPKSWISMETNLVKLNPETAEAEIVGELSYETAAMFAPLSAETAAKEEHANVPEFDAAVLPTPILSMHNLTMGVGNSQSLTFVCDPWYAENKDMVWTSSDESVATVDQNGLVTAVSDGSCTITVASAGDENKADTCEVTVASLTLNINGIVSRSEGGINSVYGSKFYRYNMLAGQADLELGTVITAPEEFQGYGLNIGAAIEARDSIWACEFGNAGMIYEIDKDTGVVKDMKYPIDGDMMFGFDYSEATDMFSGIMNFYFYADLSMDDAMYEEMTNSYDPEKYQYTYHKFDLSAQLAASDKGFNTGETNQGSVGEIVFCGITAVDNTKGTSYYVTSNFDGMGYPGESTYTPDTTHVILDNVGRLWYIDETTGLSLYQDEWMSAYVNEDYSMMISADNTGVFAQENGDGTYNVFMIRKIQETPLTQMYLNGTMPRITYHFSDIYYAGESEHGEPMFFLSMYDYWHEGTSNELFLYVQGIPTGKRVLDENWNWVDETTPDSLYDLGDTQFGNIIATITSAEVVDGLPAPVIPEPDEGYALGAGIYMAER